MNRKERLRRHRESQGKYRKSKHGREVCLRYNRKWKKDNREKCNKYHKKWLKKNPNYYRQWRKKHPNYYSKYNRNRRKKHGN